ncbi:MAG: hypothetical protein Q7S83_02955 [bacterium]|nr:hypothetical protein [bacterium]
MSFWGGLGVLALLFLGVSFVICVALGKLLRVNRLQMEDCGIADAVWAIRKFIDQEVTGDVQFHIRRRDYYDEIVPEEEAGIPEACVVCRAFDRKDTEKEDARPPLLVIDGHYIPLCSGHKDFVKEFEGRIKEGISSSDESEKAPSG